MKIIQLFIFLAVMVLTSCTSSKSKTLVKNEVLKTENCEIAHQKYLRDTTAYIELLPGDNIRSFVDKEITFYGKISEMPMQHMMRSAGPIEGSEAEKHKYIEPTDNYKGGQIVAYYYDSKVKWPENKEVLRFFGTMKSMKGAGKGGGEHTEFYLMLDAVE